ncbi:MAG: hypothetical protein R2867_20240 [Caldilineaceae bacterium]
MLKHGLSQQFGFIRLTCREAVKIGRDIAFNAMGDQVGIKLHRAPSAQSATWHPDEAAAAAKRIVV